ncbi:Asp-tRNA(Asn)/Glu-tRNA(Gln) amidotransferase subunit GatC [Roseibacillus persicicus]|uniref:Aspartyl/glutamyl-tRNA(Asn/Gln) amidotransferase subunit C n=1 Tax=Roseibacillus persicicus TaxID=454148 RepID=A0A918WIU6_9BACT|nr:Asp-tRNA(Asn)/Glu-tRNA(Gln) amidotransferase subunit GatC [Roseibacillus persicicus]MDQ8189364.1 Asp-tRNA(Asn)/Glu-tRNA(Gln) amidotransferase subunit GatC [Roseibacillus persicicus]GHC55732.1 aspartyl/glutamyl-tRNA(Asn/Gln) amidotransferase subunit C [Roseibacillus persicicus]
MPDNELALKRIAELARLDLTDEELATFESQLTPILKHIDTLSAIDVDGVEPTAHPTPVYDVMRADTTRPGLSTAAVLQNAPESAQDQIRVPKVVDAS